MNALQKIKLSKESILLVAELKVTDISPMDKIRASRRLNAIVVELGGVASPQSELTPEGAEAFHNDLKSALDEDNLSNNTNDDNYRWKDTAVIEGARKHMSALLSEAKKQGRNVTNSELDWDELTEDPRTAESLIKKVNIFGVVDWNALRDAGMPSNVAYLIKRIYTAVDKAPLDPLNSQSMRNYVTGITSLREKLESCRDYEQVKDALVEISKYLVNPKHLLQYYKNPEDMKSYTKLESLETRTYTELGTRFFSWMFKSGNKALAECKNNRVPSTRTESKGANWEWLDGEPKVSNEDGTPAKPKKTRFQLDFADHIERVGGTAVDLKSSKQLEELFGFRGIQSGNWVLKDRSSAEFHMKAAAESMLDMSDVLGIPARELGLNGNLALAFGARGKGGAMAHYEPANKVINITKLKGGGALGHEYFHAMDNLIRDLSTGTVGSATFYCTRDYKQIEDKELSAAFGQLNKALLTRNDVMAYKSQYRNLDEPLEPRIREFMVNSAENFGRNIGVGNSVDVLHNMPISEITELTEAFYQRKQRGTNANIRSMVERYLGEYLILRHYDVGDVELEDGGVVAPMKGAESQSLFYKESLGLDEYKIGKYWSKEYEMAARAFSAYLDDKLGAMGRKNTYLTYNTKDAEGKGTLAHPSGTERNAVNEAFDEIFRLVRDKKVFESAAKDQALMDSLFNQDLMPENIVFEELEDDQSTDENFPIDDPEDEELNETDTSGEDGSMFDMSYPPDEVGEAYKHLCVLLTASNWVKSSNPTAHGTIFINANEHYSIRLFEKLWVFDVAIFDESVLVNGATFNGASLSDVVSFINAHILQVENMLGDGKQYYSDDEMKLHDVQAQAAATSPINEGESPSQEQLIANDYKTAKIQIAGMKIAIENPIGSVRRGIDEKGQEWETEMTAHYGFIEDTMGADGDELDIFIAPNTDPDYQGRVFVISQIDHEGKFDEHKIVIGVASKVLAKALYQSHYDENYNGVSSIVEYSVDDFKARIYGRTALYDSMQPMLLDSWSADGHFEMIQSRKLNYALLDMKMNEAKATVKEPIVVLLVGNKYQLIHGRKRLEIANKNSETLVPAIIFDESEGYSKADIKKAIQQCGNTVHAEALGALIEQNTANRLEAAL